LQTDQKLLN